MNKIDLQTIEAKDLSNLSFEEIDAIQDTLNAQNLETIENAYEQHRINDYERDYLLFSIARVWNLVNMFNENENSAYKQPPALLLQNWGVLLYALRLWLSQ